MNRLMSRLDLSCEILGPLLAGWLLLPTGVTSSKSQSENFTAFLIVAFLNLVSFVPEL